VLQKRGPLDAAEWDVMRRHTLIGAAMLKDSKVPFMRMAARIAACHHEKWNGSGYPRGMSGEMIPQEARITAIADVFDALSNARHYKAAWDTERVKAELLACRGSHFDPALVDLFLAEWETFERILKANPDVEQTLDLDEGIPTLEA
ncbi:MAG: HD-GYP domain-containing protein, partial [Gemmatimonadales bacterium]